jgi:alcohol dehydrogenase
MDAFTQLLESFVSTGASRFTDAIALDALKLVSQYLPRAVNHGEEDLEARSAMAYAALISGITLANAGLGVVHGFASSVGGHFSIPHGLVCGTLMGPANKITIEKILENKDDQGALSKYALAGKIFINQRDKSDAYFAEGLVDLIEKWTADFGIGKLSDYGVRSQDIALISSITSNKNNPVKLSPESLGRILAQRL